MAHAYQSIKSFRESGSQVTWNTKTTNQIFLLILFESWRFLKISFLQLKPIYGGGDGGFLKYMSVNPIELEVVAKDNVIISFKYINISNVHHTVESLYLKLARASGGGCLREILCVIYDFISEIIFCWNHYRYGFLKFVRVSKRMISKTYIKNKKKNFGKRVSCKYLKR